MLPIFSVILECRMDGRNSSDRQRLGQSLYCMCILHSRHFKANPNTFILPDQLELITEHAFRRAQMLN